MKIFIPFISLFFSVLASADQCETHPDQPAIRYLGVGALDIHYQNQRLLTDPFYSPQSLWRILSLTPYTSNPQQIQSVLGPDSNKVNAILIGHGHYDHAADVPAIETYFNNNIKIFSSLSTAYMLESKLPSEQLVGYSKSDFNQWRYIANGWIRIKATPSEHAPQALGINLFPHIHDHALTELPKYIWQWSQGTNITWLVDFLSKANSEKVKQRIFIQTSASAYPVGAPEITDNIAIDKMFLAAASFDHVADYPTGLIRHYQPEEVVFIHWENFFKDWFKQPEALRLIDFDKLMSQETLANQAKNAVIGQPNHCY